MRKNILLFMLLLLCINLITSSERVELKTTIHGNKDSPLKRSFVINAEEYYHENDDHRYKREARSYIVNDPLTKINYLNDTHKQLMVHWVGDKSEVVICLARDPSPIVPSQATVHSSAVYISYDDGDTYVNRTDNFRMPNGSYATLEKFYNHPRYNTHFVFTDVRHNTIFVTTDHGKKFKLIQLMFKPCELSFHDFMASTFVILDKEDGVNKLWITENFGETFELVHEMVKNFFWLKDTNENYQLLVQRYEPDGFSTVIYWNWVTSHISQVYATNIKDLFLKGDYLFSTKKNDKGSTDLYASYKLGKQNQCVFNSALELRSFFIVDVSGNRALVAVSHSDVKSHLYVSENLEGVDGKVRFTLSLEDVFAFFPNHTWSDTWLHHLSEDAFADVYKVEGISGIYIASKMISQPTNNNIGPQNLGSLISFDHGGSWRLIPPPAYDMEGQSTGCLASRECSLHLSQKFSQLYPETRSIGILSSKSAPGIIIATGVLGSNLKGHYGVYVSLDAGLSWKQTLRDLYFFNMGDHGGIFTAVKYYKSKGETRHILFSVDEGETWNQTLFYNEDIRLYGLMTEPGENTTVFTMFGSLPIEHSWIILKVNFVNIFTDRCKPEDYKIWSPSQNALNRSYIACILGEQTTYQRRMPHVNCLNGVDFVHVVSKKVCECDIYDFECDFGFKKSGQPPRCIIDNSLLKFDPYKTPDNCKPGNYHNRTKGYRKISGDVCTGGFDSHYLPDIVPCPFKEIDDFLLFAQRERISRFNLVTKKLDELPIKNLKNVIAIDFDMENNCVFWADIALDLINRQCFSNGSKTETLVANNLASIEGMAFDWIAKTLYFVDGVRAKIELIRTDISHSGRMRRTILDNNVLRKPRGIAVHPVIGYMFWTDWSVENPSVNRANLDGTDSLILFGKDKVEWPNGITLDYISNRIYWVDARKDYIASSDLHGDLFLKVVHDEDVVSHPFAVAVFKNNMYWDDWKRNSIFSADKENFHGVEIVVKQLLGLMDLKVYAHGIQIGSNACVNASCTHICVGLPKKKFACLCPTGMQMKSNKCLCPGEVKPFANNTCPKVGNTCSAEHFSCGNGMCVPQGWKCDGADDCGDNSDEANQCGPQTCPPTFHACGDGKCLPHYWRCDYDADCADGSDELNCPKHNCTADQFLCENGRCISSKWQCDGENDCRDGSDERNCNINAPSTCKGDEFHCKTGAVTCVPTTWKCDGESDCRDGSDELDCSKNICSENQFACGPPMHRCIFNTWLCDGDRDCPDGRDEKNCSTSKPQLPQPPTDHFIPKDQVCHDWMFKCKNDRCIPFWWKCDEVNDCGDSSDELGCNNSDRNVSPMIPTYRPQVTCTINQFQCLSGQCIMASWVCDGMYDCVQGEDEEHCDGNSNCTSEQFKCRSDGSCIPLPNVCNGQTECPDGSDEVFCEHDLPNGPPVPSCSLGFFPCEDGSCYPLSLRCDGKIDCKSGFDEVNCSKMARIYQVMQMGVDQLMINDTSLLLYWSIPTTSNLRFEFLPSITKVGEKKWQNMTWTDDYQYEFLKLQPYTKYNMTVYVRVQNTEIVFPPAKYFIASTEEGVPSKPWNVSVQQRNGSHVLVSWNRPLEANGIIVNYQIIWAPVSSPEIKLKLSGNKTSHFLSSDFEHNRTYTFQVTAFNRHFESNRSEPARVKFDGETNLNRIQNLKISSITNLSIALEWIYDGECDGFLIEIKIEKPYPKIQPLTVKITNAIIKLAPGVTYQFEVYAFRNGLEGPHSFISATTDGQRLPEITIIKAITVKDLGTTVKLSWERPEKMSKTNWFYGIYYGINYMQLFEKPRLNTTNLTVTISNLKACESYMFSIGIVGPYGYGPISKNFQKVVTSENIRAAPKNVLILPDVNPLGMRVQWAPSCTTLQPDSYFIIIKEMTSSKVFKSKVYGPKLYRIFEVDYGGIYEVRVASAVSSPMFSKPVIYEAPPILPPIEISVFPEINGSYFVYWTLRDVPQFVGLYEYEVFVQEGNSLNESNALKFTVDKPPFIYTNNTANTYTFAVRIKTENGLTSMLSEAVSKHLEQSDVAGSIGLFGIAISSIVILLALLAVIGFLVIRNRRLNNSFLRFANSHYNTQSGSATFDHSGLDEEESPRIVGFSDDEPLVIA